VGFHSFHTPPWLYWKGSNGRSTY